MTTIEDLFTDAILEAKDEVMDVARKAANAAFCKGFKEAWKACGRTPDGDVFEESMQLAMRQMYSFDDLIIR